MKNINFFIFITILIFIVSCAHQSIDKELIERSPSNINVNDEYFQIKKAGNKIEDGENIVRQNFEQIKELSINPHYEFQITYDLQLVENNNLPKSVAFHFDLDVHPKTGNFSLLISHTKDAFEFSHSVEELIFLIRQAVTPMPGKAFGKVAIFELLYNAKKGDPIALDNFLKIRDLYDDTQKTLILSEEEFLEIKDKIHNFTEKARYELANKIKNKKLEAKNLKEQRKKILESLDKASNDEQFRTLVTKNDRQGVAELLRKYLPFEDMPPFEKKFWENQLEIITNPVPLEERVLIYRGLDDDYLHLGFVNGKELSKELALKEGKISILSTLLVKNQGSWNRRLRSLEAMNQKGLSTYFGQNEFTQSSRIATTFMNHSSDPMGSPFISFSPDFEIAKSFGNYQSGAFLVDPRSIIYNYSTVYPNEMEFLKPLVTFPDEIISLWTEKYHASEDPSLYHYNNFMKRIQELYGPNKSRNVISKITKNSADFFSPLMTPMLEGSPEEYVNMNYGSFFKQFSSTIKSKNLPPINEKGELNCFELFKILWQ